MTTVVVVGPHELLERQTTDEEYTAGPDFAGIADSLDLMDRLGADGW